MSFWKKNDNIATVVNRRKIIFVRRQNVWEEGWNTEENLWNTKNYWRDAATVFSTVRTPKLSRASGRLKKKKINRFPSSNEFVWWTIVLLKVGTIYSHRYNRDTYVFGYDRNSKITRNRLENNAGFVVLRTGNIIPIRVYSRHKKKLNFFFKLAVTMLTLLCYIP